jgi:LysW-gamma-L-lysine carboxypeptidase
VKDYAVDLLTRMVRTYSPTGEEDEVSDLLVSEMRSLGFRSWKDQVGNAIGEFGTGDPKILLCGHMDTVPGELPVRLEGNKLYGRGAVDAKPALAAMVVASSILLKEGFTGKITVIGAVDEEGKGKGVKHIVKKELPADYAVFGEPSGVDNVTIAYKGSLHLKITCETETGHSSAPWLFDNAIENVFELWSLLKKIHFSQERVESRFYSVTSCMTGIKGGGAFSTVPSRCKFEVDFRVPPPLSTSMMLKEVESVIEEYEASLEGVNVDLEVEDFCEPFETDKHSLLVRALAWGIRKVKGKTVTLLRKTGTGDMNLLGRSMGIPVVTYGAGDSRLDHTPDECVDIGEYVDSIRVYCEGLRKLSELHKRLKDGR